MEKNQKHFTGQKEKSDPYSSPNPSVLVVVLSVPCLMNDPPLRSLPSFYDTVCVGGGVGGGVC